MNRSRGIAAALVVALLLVVAEFFLQARNYVWLTDFFDPDRGASAASGSAPFSSLSIRAVWAACVGLLLIIVVLVSRRLVAIGVLVVFTASLSFTPSALFLSWRDVGPVLDEVHRADNAFQIGLGLIVLAAVGLFALVLLPKSAD